MEHKKRRQKIILVLKLCLSVIMAIHFVLLYLFLPEGKGILILVGPFLLGFAVINTVLAFKGINKPITSFIVLLIILVISLCATGLTQGTSHGMVPPIIVNEIGANIASFVMISYLIVSIITSTLSIFCIVLSGKKQ